jgi:hypothetical protein
LQNSKHRNQKSITQSTANIKAGGDESVPWSSAEEMYATIDAIQEGNARGKQLHLDTIRDYQGLVNPQGLEGRVQRVRVRVGISVPLANPYP